MLREFDPSLLSSLFTFVEHSGTTPAGGNSQICGLDARRVALIVSASALSFLRPVKPAIQNVGINVPSGGTQILLSFRDYPGLIGQSWFLFNGAATPWYAIEIIYLTPPE